MKKINRKKVLLFVSFLTIAVIIFNNYISLIKNLKDINNIIAFVILMPLYYFYWRYNKEGNKTKHIKPKWVETFIEYLSLVGIVLGVVGISLLLLKIIGVL